MSETESKQHAAFMETLAALCKRRGFIFPSSEIYGGINGFWDYGPLGAELKRNVRDLWWRAIVRERDDVVGLDATIIMHPKIWKASGHVDTFTDPMIDCKNCKGRFRADQIDEISCPQKPSKSVRECPGEKTEPRAFNLMFKTIVGPIESAENVAYLRPETAQAIFAQFKNVLDTSRQKIPFGIGQIGKAFRNEVTPRNYTFRSREFEQMELEFFIRPDEAVELIYGRVARPEEISDWSAPPRPDWGWEAWHKYWVEQRLAWYCSIGLPTSSLVEYWQPTEELAHYARACVDIQFAFPFGTQELEGIAARGDFDLSQHQLHSGKSQEVFDEELKSAAAKMSDDARAAFADRVAARWQSAGQTADAARAFCAKLFEGRYIPHVIEPSAGVDRLVLALLCNAYAEDSAPDEKGNPEIRTVLRFDPKVAPVKLAVFPLLKNRPELVEKARAIYDRMRGHWNVFYDESGAIGRRYRRQDEIGTPFGVTVDFQTLEDDTVTWRDRDTMAQIRIPSADIPARLAAAL
jgi:glycyl-tRNA synthetase